MPYSKANLKSRKVNLRTKKKNTRKNIKHSEFLSRKERIAQLAIAGHVLLEQVDALQDEGAIPALPAVEGAPDPLDQVLPLDQAVAVLHAAADQAAEPEPLHRQIAAQEMSARRRTSCAQFFTIRNLITIFMGIAAPYYASFPLHAAPHEPSLFDTAASHLSLAGTLTGLLSLPSSGILSHCALGAKALGKAVRNYNARTGRFPNAPGNAERRVLNVAEYDPVIGTPLSLGRVGGIAATAAFDAITGRPVALINVGSAVFTSSFADVSVNVGARLGATEENALKKAATLYGPSS